MTKIEEKFPILSEDSTFKAVFANEENILIKMISDITGIKKEIFKDNVILETDETSIKIIDEKARNCDFIIRLHNDNIITIELNKYGNTGEIAKNLYHLFNLFDTEPKYNEDYEPDPIIIQISFSYLDLEKYDRIKPLGQYYLIENEPNKIYTKNAKIYELNILKCHNIYHKEDINNIPNYIKWGELLYCKNIEDIPNITKDLLTPQESNLIINKISKEIEKSFID